MLFDDLSNFMQYRLIFYDTETTGTRPDRDRIIEIAAYDPLENRTFSSLINPKMPIPEESSRIHNITDDMVKEAPDFSAVGKEFFDFCYGNCVLVAHNNDAFDKLFLYHESQRESLTLPSFSYIDSLKWARKYRPDLPKHSLQFLREIYGIEENNAHRALDDVIVLARIFQTMIDDLSVPAILSLLSSKPKPPTTMPFGKYQGKPLAEIPKDYVAWLEKNDVFEKPGNEELKNVFAELGFLEAKT